MDSEHLFSTLHRLVDTQLSLVALHQISHFLIISLVGSNQYIYYTSPRKVLHFHIAQSVELHSCFVQMFLQIDGG